MVEQLLLIVPRTGKRKLNFLLGIPTHRIGITSSTSTSNAPAVLSVPVLVHANLLCSSLRTSLLVVRLVGYYIHYGTNAGTGTRTR